MTIRRITTRASFAWIEPFAGAAAVALRLIGGPHLLPPVAWMGGKRRMARAITLAMGVPVRERPGRVALADAGPWGWVWPAVLGEEGPRICETLRSWKGEHPRDLWERLAAEPPREDLAERCAQWLWLQARSASGVPVWWSEWRWLGCADGRPIRDRGEDLRWPGHREERRRWEQGSGEARPPQPIGQRGLWQASDGRGEPRPAGQRAGPGRGEQQGGPRKGGRCAARATMSGGNAWRMGEEVKKSRRGDRTISQGSTSTRAGGIIHPSTIAERIEAIREAFARVEVEVHHGAAAALPVVVEGPTFCYLDPPYVGATGYGWDCPRAAVLDLARRWAGAGAVVAVSEAEPLELEGWHSVEITRSGGKPEWLTISREAAVKPVCQFDLFGG